jgi:hypothetical protein
VSLRVDDEHDKYDDDQSQLRQADSGEHWPSLLSRFGWSLDPFALAADRIARCIDTKDNKR